MHLHNHSPIDRSHLFSPLENSVFVILAACCVAVLKGRTWWGLIQADSSQGTDCITALWRASNAGDIFRAVMRQASDLSCHSLCLWGKLPPNQSLPSSSKPTTLICAAGRKPCLSKLCSCQRIPIFTGVSRALGAIFPRPCEQLLEIVSVSLSFSAYLQMPGGTAPHSKR